MIKIIRRHSRSIANAGRPASLHRRQKVERHLQAFIRSTLLLFSFLSSTLSTQAQVASKSSGYNISGALSITNKGISTIPTFTLGKPAFVFDGSAGRKLRFEPQLRFALEGKPWTFIFWWRYDVVRDRKFQFRIGAHPALSFRTSTLVRDGVSEDVIEARRFLAGDALSHYSLSRHVGIGSYYLYSHGFEESAPANTHYVGLNVSLSISIAQDVVVSASPQIYYLRVDDEDGVYLTSRITFAHRDLPISASAIINKVIQTDVSGSQDFLWNVSVIYAFEIARADR